MSMILLSEGRRDTEFFHAFCREIGLKNIKVSPPSSQGAGGDGKGNALALLPELLMQLRDGSLERLGIIVDADYQFFQNQGFKAVTSKVRETLSTEGYILPGQAMPSGGLLFRHRDGLPTIGLWVMPNNKDDGLLEDFIKESITDENQTPLLTAACSTVKQISEPLFDIRRHSSKAELATWMAWQKVPGQPLAATVGSKLMDLSSKAALALRQWLEAVFT